jgi:hypothetical protein
MEVLIRIFKLKLKIKILMTNRNLVFLIYQDLLELILSLSIWKKLLWKIIKILIDGTVEQLKKLGKTNRISKQVYSIKFL